MVWTKVALALEGLTLKLLDKTKYFEKGEIRMEPWHIGTHLRVISKSFSMDTAMTGLIKVAAKDVCGTVPWTKK